MDDFCYCDDGDPAIFYRKTEVRRAREVHRCYECHRAILPGESYERVHALWDRYEGPEIVATCAWCMELREWITATVPCFCFMHGYLLEGAYEAVDHYAHETTGLRFGYARRKVEIERRPRVSEVIGH